MSYIVQSPILLIGFNHLDTLKQVLNAIESVRPSRIYLANDGARIDKIDSNGIDESSKVKAIRDYLIKNILLKCKIKTRFLESNLYL